MVLSRIGRTFSSFNTIIAYLIAFIFISGGLILKFGNPEFDDNINEEEQLGYEQHWYLFIILGVFIVFISYYINKYTQRYSDIARVRGAMGVFRIFNIFSFFK